MSTETYADQLTVGPTTLTTESYAIALPLGSELRKEINIHLLELMESADWKASITRYLGSD